MRNDIYRVAFGAARKQVLAGGLVLAAAAGLAQPALAQGGAIQQYGEIPGVRGIAQTTITVEPGNYATLIAVAQASGGKPVGKGVIERAGIGVDVYVGDQICTADRDIRRQIDVASFKGKFATSATCMTVLKPGKHKILAERTSINEEGSKMVLKYSVFGGKPEHMASTAN